MTPLPAAPWADPATDPSDVARAAAQAIRERTGADRHDVAVVLGSGWAGAADLMGEVRAVLDNAEIPGFAPALVDGHHGTIRSVALGGSTRSPTGTALSTPGTTGSTADTNAGGAERRALVFGTRTHLYEGRGTAAVAHAVRTAAAAGCRTVVLTNGCGALRPQWPAGTPVLISDHINLTGATPLDGPTFVDLTDLYSARLRALARSVDPGLAEGVYVQFRGPQYETPAEVRMADILGGDLVGMSTALEAIAARAAGLEVLGISLVTNPAAGLADGPLSHEEVVAAGRSAAARCSRLLADLVAAL